MLSETHPSQESRGGGSVWRGWLATTFVLGTLLVAGLASGQETTGSISGRVTDATGSAIPGANVTIIHEEDRTEVKTQTNEGGVFIAREMRPGAYTVIFESEGFSRREAPELELLAGKTLRVDVQMEVGQVAETVYVSAAAQIIDPTSALVAQNVTNEQFDSLPKGRDFTSLAILSPSVNTGRIEGGFQVNGASAAENNFYVDGVSINSVIDGSARQTAQFDYLEEVQIKTNGISAEYGGALGGVVTAITKSGGNDFHGSAHFYYYGNGIGANSVPRLELNPETQADFRYVQDDKQKDNNYEIGGSLGGPIIPNKMFFYTAASPRWRRRENDYLFNNGETPGSMKRKFHQSTWFNKLTIDPVDAVRANLSFLYTPTYQEGSLFAYNGYEPNVSTIPIETALASADNGFNQPENTLSGQLDFTLNSTSTLSVKGGRYYLNYKEVGIQEDRSYWWRTSSIGVEGLPPGLQQPVGFTTPSAGQIFFDKTTRTYVQADFSKLFQAAGTHNLRVGTGVQKNVNSVNETWNGERGRVRVYFDSEFRGDRGPFGYYFVEDGATEGSTGGTITHLYINDNWRVTPKLALTLGLRTERETIPSFARSVQDYAFRFGFGDKMAPRLGAAYDVFGDGRLKISGAWGRYYDWTKYDVARGTFGAERWHIYYRSIDNLDAFVDPDDPNSWQIDLTNLPGRNLWPGEFRDLRVPGFDLLDPDIKPMSSDVMNVGTEMQLGRQYVFSARYSRSRLNRTIEDLGALDEEGNEVYRYGNPGEGRFTVFPSSGATCPQQVNGACGFPMPKATRRYDAMELQIQKRLSNGWFGTASYVFSRLGGNYAGIQSTDEIRAPTTGSTFGGNQQFSGNNYRSGGNANRYFDLDEIMFDSNGNYVDGRLPTDRPHVFKLFGSKRMSWGTEIGGFFRAMSGTPVTTQVWTINGIPNYVNNRGDAGRTPFFTQTDLMVAHVFQLSETKRLRFEFNLDNLFNQKTSMFQFQNLNKEERGASSEIDLHEVDLTQGFDYNQLIRETSDGEFAFDPRFGKDAWFNAGFQGRFLVKFIF